MSERNYQSNKYRMSEGRVLALFSVMGAIIGALLAFVYPQFERNENT